MTCKKCVHFDICDSWYKDIEAQGLVVGEMSQQICEDFKNKADFVEIVKCKDCKYSRNCDDNDGAIMCVLNSEKDEETDIDCGFLSFHSKNHFCSYGERVIK